MMNNPLRHLPWFRNLVQAIVLATLCAGCASPYWQNRRADAADVFTATVGVGLGATARIGPIHAGLGGNADLYGIEAGEVGDFGDFGAVVVGTGDVAADICFVCSGSSVISQGSRSAARGKDVAYRRSGIPFWNPPPPESPNPARWTQIEVAAGLLSGARLGFNPGELLDFVLGFFGADIYGDDLEGSQEDWAVLAERKKAEGEARRLAASRKRLRFDEWSGAEGPALRDWRDWTPDLSAPGRTVVQMPRNLNESLPADGKWLARQEWQLKEPNLARSDLTNTWNVTVHAFAIPREAREHLFRLLDRDNDPEWRNAERHVFLRRENSDAPGEVCFVRNWREKTDAIRFVRDGVVVSIFEYSYGHESSVLDLAHDLDKQILAKLEPNTEGAEPEPHAESAEDAE